MEIINKHFIILFVILICFGLLFINVYQYNSNDTKIEQASTKLNEPEKSSSTKTNKMSKNSKPKTNNNLHHDEHFGEGSFDHGETAKLTKHDVQKFLLKYFGLENDDENDTDFFNSSSTNEENKNTKNLLEYEEIKLKIPKFCESRRKMVWDELNRFASPSLLRALKEQRKRHEAVASGKPFPGQKYLIWSLSGGLGNRFQSLVSCFVAALLSKRVFLMKDWFEPLPHSSVKQTPIVIDSPNTDHYFLENLAKILKVESDRAKNEELLCPLFPMMSLREFVSKYPNEFDKDISEEQVKGKSTDADALLEKHHEKPFGHPQHVKIDIAARHDKTLRRWNRIFCSNLSANIDNNNNYNKMKPLGNGNGMAKEANFFFPEKFVYIWTNQHFLPAFFANPFHSKQMKEMFPDFNPYSVLVRALVMPSLPVVKKVRDFFELNSENLLYPLDYVGLQIRAFREKEIAELGKYFEQCFERDASPAKSKMKRNDNDNNQAPFFLATLHSVVRQQFEKKYGTGRVVTLAPARGEQGTGNAFSDQEALTDMFLLAFSRDLIVSPGSTFGSFVAVYAQTHPRVVSWDGATMKVKCDRSKHLEPCFASLLWYDKLMNGRQNKFSCLLEKIPDGVSGCVM